MRAERAPSLRFTETVVIPSRASAQVASPPVTSGQVVVVAGAMESRVVHDR